MLFFFRNLPVIESGAFGCNKEYITSLKKGGYATEDDYIEHIMSIIERYRELGIFKLPHAQKKTK